MNRLLTFVGGVGIGAGLMYYFDIDRGRRHRAMLRDQLVHALIAGEDGLDKTLRDLSHRLGGLTAELRYRLAEENVPDDVLVARVRSRIGRIVSHPGALDIIANQGEVTVRGPILTREVDPVLVAVASVPGVHAVHNELEAHEHPDKVSALMGDAKAPGDRFELLQENWSPAARLAVGTIGSTLGLYALQRRGILGTMAGVLSVGMLARAIFNLPLATLLGLSSSRRAVDIHKTITVNAGVERVFDLWTNFENFPRFMAHVDEVKRLGDNRYYWKVEGPAGTKVAWDAIVTKLIPNQLVAWKSVEGTPVRNAGMVRFQQNPDGSTRMDIQLSYNPPGGVLGHLVASLFGADPKHAMDDDLVRFKSLVEVGKTTAHGQHVTMDQILHPGEQGRKAA